MGYHIYNGMLLLPLWIFGINSGYARVHHRIILLFSKPARDIFPWTFFFSLHILFYAMTNGRGGEQQSVANKCSFIWVFIDQGGSCGSVIYHCTPLNFSSHINLDVYKQYFIGQLNKRRIN